MYVLFLNDVAVQCAENITDLNLLWNPDFYYYSDSNIIIVIADVDKKYLISLQIIPSFHDLNVAIHKHKPMITYKPSLDSTECILGKDFSNEFGVQFMTKYLECSIPIQKEMFLDLMSKV